MEKINILAVDDRRENLLAMEAILTDSDIQLFTASSGQEALSLMLDTEFAVVLLDVQMPEMDGFETAEYMRIKERTKYTPIIFVTAISKEQKHIFKGYESGAVDYIFKPLDPDILKSKVKVFLDLYRQKQLLKQNIDALKHANQQILAQQKAKIEEERLKTLLQLSGATAHELNQPLMILLGNIELMRNFLHDPEAINRYMDKAEAAGQRISEVVRKIQMIQQDRVRKHDGENTITDIHQKIQMLYVEDDDSYYRSITEIAGTINITVERATSLHEAIQKMQNRPFHLVLLDYYLQDGTGMDFMHKMESEGVMKPVVVITGDEDEMIAAKMIQAGAYGYIHRTEIKPEALSLVVYNALEKEKSKKELIAVQQRIAHLEFTDELTGTYNQRYIFEALQWEIAVAERYNVEISLCILGLDHFKQINDNYSYLAGDAALSETAAILNKSLRKSDLIGRYGGEEFILIFPQTTVESAVTACDRIRKEIADYSFRYNDGTIKTTISVGIAGYARGITTKSLIDMAEAALVQAKSEGRNKVMVNRR